eukprot:CAMPEP_0170637042 /NCGR_PEP_ID=MMETSP0224-20130122/38177_1 /TAXON_ID=285029 /ORGANISM="Togula jolla, Strain CCCM 725" /LENGTH=32 /DNA_ID= /DNA_START= /DNA_END= /DNA_ORIENTATION=
MCVKTTTPRRSLMMPTNDRESSDVMKRSIGLI